MALETLKEVTEIDGNKIRHIEDGMKHDLEKMPALLINHDTNTIAFRIQKGPIKENGVNGCQVDAMVIAAKEIITKLNAQFPCDENEKVIFNLEQAVLWLRKRRENREQRGVEGTNQV